MKKTLLVLICTTFISSAYARCIGTGAVARDASQLANSAVSVANEANYYGLYNLQSRARNVAQDARRVASTARNSYGAGCSNVRNQYNYLTTTYRSFMDTVRRVRYDNRMPSEVDYRVNNTGRDMSDLGFSIRNMRWDTYRPVPPRRPRPPRRPAPRPRPPRRCRPGTRC